MRALVYKLIRPLFVKDIDPNEDFICGHCSKPLLRRYLFCSMECAHASGLMDENYSDDANSED